VFWYLVTSALADVAVTGIWVLSSRQQQQQQHYRVSTTPGSLLLDILDISWNLDDASGN